MSDFLGITVSNDLLVECAVAQYSDQLDLHTGDAGSWGLGYYHRGELLQRIQPHEKGTIVDARSVISGLRADVIVMHTRRATVGDVRRENVHPFRFSGWMFAHNGTVEGFSEFSDKLRSSMPPFILRGLKGDTDSEHLFHLFMSFLYDTGLLGRPDLGIEEIGSALQRTFSTVDEFARSVGAEPSPASAIVSDGYSLVVLSRGVPVDYVLIEGVRNCTTCRSSVQVVPTTPGVDHDDLRAVIVRSGHRSTPPAGFQRLADNSFLMVTKSHGIELLPFHG